MPRLAPPSIALPDAAPPHRTKVLAVPCPTPPRRAVPRCEPRLASPCPAEHRHAEPSHSACHARPSQTPPCTAKRGPALVPAKPNAAARCRTLRDHALPRRSKTPALEPAPPSETLPCLAKPRPRPAPPDHAAPSPGASHEAGAGRCRPAPVTLPCPAWFHPRSAGPGGSPGGRCTPPWSFTPARMAVGLRRSVVPALREQRGRLVGDGRVAVAIELRLVGGGGRVGREGHDAEAAERAGPLRAVVADADLLPRHDQDPREDVRRDQCRVEPHGHVHLPRRLDLRPGAHDRVALNDRAARVDHVLGDRLVVAEEREELLLWKCERGSHLGLQAGALVVRIAELLRSFDHAALDRHGGHAQDAELVPVLTLSRLFFRRRDLLPCPLRAGVMDSHPLRRVLEKRRHSRELCGEGGFAQKLCCEQSFDVHVGDCLRAQETCLLPSRVSRLEHERRLSPSCVYTFIHYADAPAQVLKCKTLDPSPCQAITKPRPAIPRRTKPVQASRRLAWVPASPGLTMRCIAHPSLALPCRCLTGPYLAGPSLGACPAARCHAPHSRAWCLPSGTTPCAALVLTQPASASCAPRGSPPRFPLPAAARRLALRAPDRAFPPAAPTAGSAPPSRR